MPVNCGGCWRAGEAGLAPTQAQWESVLGPIGDACLGMGVGGSGTGADVGLGSPGCKEISFPYEYVPFCPGHHQDSRNLDSQVRSFLVSSFLHMRFWYIPRAC